MISISCRRSLTETVVDSNTWRTTSEEKRAAERMKEEDYNDVRRAAEVHRQVTLFFLFVDTRKTVLPVS